MTVFPVRFSAGLPLGLLLLCLTLCTALATLLVAPAEAHDGSHRADPPWQQASPWPDRIIATFAGDPSTSFSVTWRTDESVGRTIAQIVPASADARFDLTAETVRAKTSRIRLDRLETPVGIHESLENQGLAPVHYHSVTFTDLTPGTRYAYRVQGARGHWSEWVQISTAPEEGPVSFVYFGDAQNGILSHWSRVIRAAHDAAPDAGFYLHAGDLVDQGPSDWDWAQWFKAGGFLHAQIPSVPVPGNHEFMPALSSQTGEKTRVLTSLWRAQFTLPVVRSLPERLHEAVYDLRYGKDLHVFVLSSTPASYNRETFQAQAAWLDEALKVSTARWRVVTMHHPYWVPGRRERDKVLGATIGPVIDRNDVDLVLVGHIHTYMRGSSADGTTARRIQGTPRDVDTVFAISSSGAKMFSQLDALHDPESIGDGRADIGGVGVDRLAGNTPMFQVIRIDGGVLTYEAHTALGDLYDSFRLEKSADGLKQMTDGPAAFGDPRLFSNTGPYRDWYDLR